MGAVERTGAILFDEFLPPGQTPVETKSLAERSHRASLTDLRLLYGTPYHSRVAPGMNPRSAILPG